jgi:hypothetical protein
LKGNLPSLVCYLKTNLYCSYVHLQHETSPSHN